MQIIPGTVMLIGRRSLGAGAVAGVCYSVLIQIPVSCIEAFSTFL